MEKYQDFKKRLDSYKLLRTLGPIEVAVERTLAFLRPRHAIFHSFRLKHIPLVKILRFKKYLLGSFKWGF